MEGGRLVLEMSLPGKLNSGHPMFLGNLNRDRVCFVYSTIITTNFF